MRHVKQQAVQVHIFSCVIDANNYWLLTTIEATH